jgi:hypothetical protein
LKTLEMTKTFRHLIELRPSVLKVEFKTLSGVHQSGEVFRLITYTSEDAPQQRNVVRT